MMVPSLPRFPRSHGSTTQVVLIVLCLAALGVIGWMLSLPPELKGKYSPGIGENFGMIWLGLIVLVVAIMAFFMPVFVWQCARESRRCRELLQEILAFQAAMLRQQQQTPMVSYQVAEEAAEEEAESSVTETVPIYPPKAGLRTPGRERLIQ
jgi:low affinity Fe/Cu permease